MEVAPVPETFYTRVLAAPLVPVTKLLQVGKALLEQVARQFWVVVAVGVRRQPQTQTAMKEGRLVAVVVAEEAHPVRTFLAGTVRPAGLSWRCSSDGGYSGNDREGMGCY